MHVLPVAFERFCIVFWGLYVAAFTQTTGIAVLAFLAPTTAVVLGYFLTRHRLSTQDEKMNEIHVMVNSRLDEALKDVAELKRIIGTMTPSPADAAAVDEIDSRTVPRIQKGE